MENPDDDIFQLGEESYLLNRSAIKRNQYDDEAGSSVNYQQNYQIQKPMFGGLPTKMDCMAQSQGLIGLFKKKDDILSSQKIQSKSQTILLADGLGRFIQKQTNNENIDTSNKSTQQIVFLRQKLTHLQNKQKIIKQKFEKIVKTLQDQLDISVNRNNHMKKRIILLNKQIQESKNDVEELKVLIKSTQLDSELIKIQEFPLPFKRNPKSISPETLGSLEKQKQKNFKANLKKEQTQYTLPKINQSPKQKYSMRKLIGND